MFGRREQETIHQSDLLIDNLWSSGLQNIGLNLKRNRHVVYYYTNVLLKTIKYHHLLLTFPIFILDSSCFLCLPSPRREGNQFLAVGRSRANQPERAW